MKNFQEEREVVANVSLGKQKSNKRQEKTYMVEGREGHELVRITKALCNERIRFSCIGHECIDAK